MKKSVRKLLVFVLLTASMLVLASCAATGTTDTPPPTAATPAEPSAAATAATTLTVSPTGLVVTNTTMTGAPRAAVQRLVYNNVENASYDPIRVENTDELAAHMFEGLTCWSQGKLVLGQAESIDVSEDGLVYTAKLRDDIYWSDGQPVTAQDFVYSWRRELAPETAAKYVRFLYVIKNARAYNAGNASVEEVGIEAPDERTIVITLGAPAMAFMEMLAMKSYMPVRQDIVEAYGDAWSLNPDTCIGNGAFRMKQYVAGEKIVYEKNPQYYDAGQIILDEIECRFITDTSVELMSYETGEIQIATRSTAENLLRHVDESYIISRLSAMWLVVNNQDPVLSDVRVRRALALAIDRQAICDYVFKNAEQPAYSIVSVVMQDPATGKPWSETYGPNFVEDVDEAKRLLAEAGYADGKGFPVITYGTSSGTEHEEVAQAIAAMWKANLGIDCKIEVEDSASFIAHRKEGAFNVARYMTTSVYSDPQLSLGIYESGEPNNDSKYANPEFDRLLAAADAEADIVKRSELLHQLEKVLMDDMGVIPLYNPSQKLMIKPQVVGAGMSLSGSLDFKRCYIAQ